MEALGVVKKTPSQQVRNLSDSEYATIKYKQRGKALQTDVSGTHRYTPLPEHRKQKFGHRLQDSQFLDQVIVKDSTVESVNNYKPIFEAPYSLAIFPPLTKNLWMYVLKNFFDCPSNTTTLTVVGGMRLFSYTFNWKTALLN